VSGENNASPVDAIVFAEAISDGALFLIKDWRYHDQK